jgi:hypothetical protein
MVHDFWQYRADADFVRAQLPGIRTVLDWYSREVRPDGLLKKLPWWPFVDWGKDFESGVPPQDEDGGSAPITLQYVEALRYAAQLEDELGDPQLARKYRQSADRLAQAVYALCWNGVLLADTPAKKHFSQHANILGVWLDVIPAKYQKAVLADLLFASGDAWMTGPALPPMTTATYYFRFYLARALDHAGMGDEYLGLLGPWKTMFSLGLTTWAESPEPTRSDSHAWSAHPNYDLLTLVAGIHPSSPGFKSVSIEPHLGHLKHVSASMPTPSGMITVDYKRAERAVGAEITLPPGVTGELLWQGRRLVLHTHQSLSLPLAQ